MKAFQVGLMVFILLGLVPYCLAEETHPFSDLVGGWGAEEIDWLASSSVLIGYPDGAFRPEEQMSRGEFAKSAVSAFSAPSPNAPFFSDLPADYWANPFIARVEAQGWMVGYSDGAFRPDWAVTRAQALTVLVRIAGWAPGIWSDGSFPSSWSSPWLASALQHQVLRREDPCFNDQTAFADEPASRVEVAVFLARTLRQLGIQPREEVIGGLGQAEGPEFAFLAQIQSERQNSGSNVLIWDPALADFALRYAAEMGEGNFFSHDSPLTGTFQERSRLLLEAGYLTVGENIGLAQSPGSRENWLQWVAPIHQRFMDSGKHRENVLAAQWTVIGIACWWQEERFLVVEVFGRRE